MPTQIIKAVKTGTTFDDAFDARDQLRIDVGDTTENIVYHLSAADLSGDYSSIYQYDSSIDQLVLTQTWGDSANLNAFLNLLTDSALDSLDSVGWTLTFEPPLS